MNENNIDLELLRDMDTLLGYVGELDNYWLDPDSVGSAFVWSDDYRQLQVVLTLQNIHNLDEENE